MSDAPANVWQFLILVWTALYTHGTRVLGIAQGTVALVAAMTDIIPQTQVKYYLAASAILTFWRGQGNADKIADKVVAKAAAELPLDNPLEIHK
jgi:hypothetical protein